MADTITVHVNDDVFELSDDHCLPALLDRLGIDARGTAVAINGEVAPKSQWHARCLADGDHVEVLTVAQGG